MLKEILKIFVQLEEESAKKAEKNLSKKFGNVSKKFGKGLKDFISGNVMGVAVAGLVAKLLNPLEEIENKMKAANEAGKELTEVADRFATSPGALKRLQLMARAMGVSPEQIQSMLESFATNLETARDELADPMKERSETTKALEKYAGTEDIVKAFMDFRKDLQKTGPQEIFLREQDKKAASSLSQEEKQSLEAAGLMRTLSARDAQRNIERQVLGQAQTGSAKRFLMAPDPGSRVELPTEQALSEAINKTSKLADLQAKLAAQNEGSDIVSTASRVNAEMVEQMMAAQKRQAEVTNSQMQSYEDLRKAAVVTDEIKHIMSDGLGMISKLIGKMDQLGEAVNSIRNSKLVRGFFGGGDR